MAGPTARAHLDALWKLLDSEKVDWNQLRKMARHIEGDTKLSDVERASLLAMVTALTSVKLPDFDQGAP